MSGLDWLSHAVSIFNEEISYLLCFFSVYCLLPKQPLDGSLYTNHTNSVTLSWRKNLQTVSRRLLCVNKLQAVVCTCTPLQRWGSSSRLPPWWASSWPQIFLSALRPSITDSWDVSWDSSRAFSFFSSSSCRLRRRSRSTSASKEWRWLWGTNSPY